MRRAGLVVLGAGPAGLAGAMLAARAGHDVMLLERGERPGGLAASFTVEGVRVDHGSHRLHRSIDAAMLAELRRLLGDDLQERPRNGRIRLAGRWIAFPLRPADLARRLPPSFAVGAARDAALAPFRRPRADTFAEVVRAGAGPTLLERFYRPYARKVWGVDADELSGETARRRISAGSPLAVLARVLRGARGPATFLYPRRGFGQIAEALERGARAAGVDLRLGAPVRAVRLGEQAVRVEVEGGEEVEAPLAWSTLPLTVLTQLVRPGPPPAVVEAAGRLRFRAMVLVYVALPVDRLTPFDAHYLPEAWTSVTRLSEPKNYRDGDDPAGRTVVCAEIPSEVGDATWTASEDELAALVAECLRGAGLPAPEPSAVAVRRLPFVYPVLRAGDEASLAAIDAWASGLGRLVSFGRGGLFVHDNTHHTLAMAQAAADALGPDGTWDGARWTSARERFAAHVVED